MWSGGFSNLESMNTFQVLVEEDAVVINLLVERAQGVIGSVTVEWQTEDAIAKSSGVTNIDYEVMYKKKCILYAYCIAV